MKKDWKPMEPFHVQNYYSGFSSKILYIGKINKDTNALINEATAYVEEHNNLTLIKE